MDYIVGKVSSHGLYFETINPLIFLKLSYCVLMFFGCLSYLHNIGLDNFANIAYKLVDYSALNLLIYLHNRGLKTLTIFFFSFFLF